MIRRPTLIERLQSEFDFHRGEGKDIDTAVNETAEHFPLVPPELVCEFFGLPKNR